MMGLYMRVLNDPRVLIAIPNNVTDLISLPIDGYSDKCIQMYGRQSV